MAGKDVGRIAKTVKRSYTEEEYEELFQAVLCLASSASESNCCAPEDVRISKQTRKEKDDESGYERNCETEDKVKGDGGDGGDPETSVTSGETFSEMKNTQTTGRITKQVSGKPKLFVKEKKTADGSAGFNNTNTDISTLDDQKGNAIETEKEPGEIDQIASRQKKRKKKKEYKKRGNNEGGICDSTDTDCEMPHSEDVNMGEKPDLRLADRKNTAEKNSSCEEKPKDEKGIQKTKKRKRSKQDGKRSVERDGDKTDVKEDNQEKLKERDPAPLTEPKIGLCSNSEVTAGGRLPSPAACLPEDTGDTRPGLQSHTPFTATDKDSQGKEEGITVSTKETKDSDGGRPQQAGQEETSCVVGKGAGTGSCAEEEEEKCDVDIQEAEKAEVASVVSEQSFSSGLLEEMAAEVDQFDGPADMQHCNEHTPSVSDADTGSAVVKMAQKAKKDNQRTNCLAPRKLCFNQAVKKKSGWEDKKGTRRDGSPPAEKGTWVQCEAVGCHKWRYLPDVHDPAQLSRFWVCSMNTDQQYNSCEKAEQDYDESDHIFTQFTLGSIVWVKMDGFPWWPAMVDFDPDHDIYCEIPHENSMVPTDYHVVFLDENVTRTWVRKGRMQPLYPEHLMSGSSYLKGHKYKKEMAVALRKAETALQMPIQKRLKFFGFAACFRNVNTKWTKGTSQKSLKRKRDGKRPSAKRATSGSGCVKGMKQKTGTATSADEGRHSNGGVDSDGGGCSDPDSPDAGYCPDTDVTSPDSDDDNYSLSGNVSYISDQISKKRTLPSYAVSAQSVKKLQTGNSGSAEGRVKKKIPPPHRLGKDPEKMNGNPDQSVKGKKNKLKRNDNFVQPRKEKKNQGKKKDKPGLAGKELGNCATGLFHPKKKKFQAPTSISASGRKECVDTSGCGPSMKTTFPQHDRTVNSSALSSSQESKHKLQGDDDKVNDCELTAKTVSDECRQKRSTSVEKEKVKNKSRKKKVDVKTDDTVSEHDRSDSYAALSCQIQNQQLGSCNTVTVAVHSLETTHIADKNQKDQKKRKLPLSENADVEHKHKKPTGKARVGIPAVVETKENWPMEQAGQRGESGDSGIETSQAQQQAGTQAVKTDTGLAKKTPPVSKICAAQSKIGKPKNALGKAQKFVAPSKLTSKKLVSRKSACNIALSAQSERSRAEPESRSVQGIADDDGKGKVTTAATVGSTLFPTQKAADVVSSLSPLHSPPTPMVGLDRRSSAGLISQNRDHFVPSMEDNSEEEEDSDSMLSVDQQLKGKEVEEDSHSECLDLEEDLPLPCLQQVLDVCSKFTDEEGPLSDPLEMAED